MSAWTAEQMELRRLNRENRELKKFLRNIATTVTQSIDVLDAAMKGPSTVERGKQIAAVCNVLEHANDSMIVFGLKIDYRQMQKIKRRWAITQAKRD